jgi:hypothetical protein
MFGSSREEKIKIGEQYVDMLKKFGFISEEGKYIAPVSSSNEERKMELKEDQHLLEQKQQQFVSKAAVSHEEMGSQSSSCDSCDLLEQDEQSVDARIIDPEQERLKHALERLKQRQEQFESKAAIPSRRIDSMQDRLLKQKFEALVKEYGPYPKANDKFIQEGNQKGNYADILYEMTIRYSYSLSNEKKFNLACAICSSFDLTKGLSLLNEFWESVEESDCYRRSLEGSNIQPLTQKYLMAKEIKKVLDPHFIGKESHPLLRSVNYAITEFDRAAERYNDLRAKDGGLYSQNIRRENFLNDDVIISNNHQPKYQRYLAVGEAARLERSELNESAIAKLLARP